MGICHRDKTLREIVDERERSFKETGCAYGLERLELVEEDPAKFMRFQMRLVASCINARESAKLISANPMSMIQGELLFMLANAEGDVISASYGLAGHIQCMPFIVRNIARLGFEEDPYLLKYLEEVDKLKLDKARNFQELVHYFKTGEGLGEPSQDKELKYAGE